jgi:negative regulator of flagellin synthesis FlgM
MKISDLNSKTEKADIAAAPARGKAAERAEASPVASANVSLSAQSQVLSTQKTGGSTAVFNAEKVSAIKAAIADGTFKVDPEKVAAGLIDTIRDLIHTRKG